MALAVVFGAADQFLGARSAVLGQWAVGASLLSAPWLLVAFIAGWTQPTAKRAAAVGAGCTLAALAGYWAMTLSPIEGAHVGVAELRGLVESNARLFVGGIVTGPLFGWFGYRWRAHRDWIAALVTALAVCCEPLVYVAVGGAGASIGGFHVWAPRVPVVWTIEIVVGLLMVLYVLAARRRSPA